MSKDQKHTKIRHREIHFHIPLFSLTPPLPFFCSINYCSASGPANTGTTCQLHEQQATLVYTKKRFKLLLSTHINFSLLTSFNSVKLTETTNRNFCTSKSAMPFFTSYTIATGVWSTYTSHTFQQEV